MDFLRNGDAGDGNKHIPPRWRQLTKRTASMLWVPPIAAVLFGNALTAAATLPLAMTTTMYHERGYRLEDTRRGAILLLDRGAIAWASIIHMRTIGKLPPRAMRVGVAVWIMCMGSAAMGYRAKPESRAEGMWHASCHVFATLCGIYTLMFSR